MMTPEQMDISLTVQAEELKKHIQALHDYAESVNKIFLEMSKEIRVAALQLAEFRYMFGDLSPIEFARGLQEFEKWDDKTVSDLDVVEIVEILNQKRDALYKRIVDGAKANENPT
jgi:hypothetical protein